MKTLTNSEICFASESRIRISLWLPISHWSVFSSDHLNLEISWAVERTIFRITQPGSGASFTVTAGFRMPQQALWRGFMKGFLNLVCFLKEASKNLVFDFPIKKGTKKVLNPQAHIEKVYWFNIIGHQKIFLLWHSHLKSYKTGFSRGQSLIFKQSLRKKP
jgi:hypothetical protein